MDDERLEREREYESVDGATVHECKGKQTNKQTNKQTKI